MGTGRGPVAPDVPGRQLVEPPGGVDPVHPPLHPPGPARGGRLRFRPDRPRGGRTLRSSRSGSRQHVSPGDVVHLHFGFEHRTPSEMAGLVSSRAPSRCGTRRHGARRRQSALHPVRAGGARASCCGGPRRRRRGVDPDLVRRGRGVTSLGQDGAGRASPPCRRRRPPFAVVLRDPAAGRRDRSEVRPTGVAGRGDGVRGVGAGHVRDGGDRGELDRGPGADGVHRRRDTCGRSPWRRAARGATTGRRRTGRAVRGTRRGRAAVSLRHALRAARALPGCRCSPRRPRPRLLPRPVGRGGLVRQRSRPGRRSRRARRRLSCERCELGPVEADRPGWRTEQRAAIRQHHRASYTRAIEASRA